MFEISVHFDTFIQSLYNISKNQSDVIDPEYLFGTTGHGSRFSLAMNVKTGKNIGHPSSTYCWDVISVVSQCFKDAHITADLYIGKDYATRARKTAAQSSRQIPDNVTLIDEIPIIEGNLIVAYPEGRWRTLASTNGITINVDEMPFGPVILDIKNMEQNYKFPRNTLQYLINTLERGEEPMEIKGKNDLSTVSGWKAFARWMQSFNVPLPNIRHQFINTFPKLLRERRAMNTEFWRKIEREEKGEKRTLSKALAERYDFIVDQLDILIAEGESIDTVRNVYFAEQKTLPVYKKIDTYLTHN